jgi:hypothetical protein
MQRQACQVRDVVVGNRLGMQLPVATPSSKQCAACLSGRTRTAQSYHLRLDNQRPLNLCHGSVLQSSMVGGFVGWCWNDSSTKLREGERDIL